MPQASALSTCSSLGAKRGPVATASTFARFISARTVTVGGRKAMAAGRPADRRLLGPREAASAQVKAAR
eukprot:CAMPEP_0119431624 /NCGR_PEP_ID=MMETSP1335-20130426/46283_1 /TAXON_ID=259385 /ORGANISM="Chrysoculter rhomboideus, Strain RCC1486" /LENGTH=68 /DNA_ID=CAMNT_0007457431 /DNA_START=80 /DNA_END=283 /DNA_ORIENTATION=+